MTDARVEEALLIALDRGEVGIQVAAYQGNDLIIDAAAGTRDGTEPVLTTTLFNPFSVTKAITATGLHILGARGLFDYDDRVSDHWPEYGAHGKQGTTIRDALSHRAGIPWMPDGVTPARQADWDWMVRQVEEMTPTFEPGTTNVYHSMIWGWIIGELIRRIDPAHRDVDVFLRDELFEPLGITDIYLGLPDSEHHRVAPLIGGGLPPDAPEFAHKAMPSVVHPSAAVYNDPVARRTVNPGAGSIGPAHSYARVFAMLANRGELDGVRILPAALVERFTEPRDQIDVPEAYRGVVFPVGAYGYWLSGSGSYTDPLLGENPHLLKHPGAGGSLSWAELDTGLAVSICHNRMHGLEEMPPAVHPYEPIIRAVRDIAHEHVRHPAPPT